MKLFGLTGKKASGKSTVASIFRHINIPVIDFDIIYSDMFKPGYHAHREIVKCFGKDFLDDEGNVDKSKLSLELFKEQWVREFVDELIEYEVDGFMEKVKEAFEFHNVSILGVESGVMLYKKLGQFVENIICVDSSKENRKIRIHIPQQAVNIINHIEEEDMFYDYLIDNNGTMEELWDNSIDIANKILKQ
jgi:dephospho-CoA kinase